jgi:F-box/leucine-rich repeat protein 10/11
MPGQSKRKSDARSDTPGPSSKKTKATRRNRQFTPMPPPSDGRKNTDQYLQLADGSIYVKKLSNLGPPRIGCESCRLKKTGCKHKEEIRARGWCDDDRLILDMDGKPEQSQDDDGDETVDDTPSKPGPAGAPVEARKDKSPPKSAFASSSSPPQKSSTVVTHKQISTLNPKPANNRAADGNGPPIGYKGRKPSCEDCKILKALLSLLILI